MNILAEIRRRFEPALQKYVDDPSAYLAMIKPAQDVRFGDFQANCAMPLQKQTGRNPRELAAEIIENVQIDDLCEAPEVAGPGFINLKLTDAWLQAAVNRLVADDRLGVESTTSPRNYVIDFSAPNVAKPMHVGHLRSTVIGDSLCRIFRFLGHKVTSDNHIGDWGTQFGMIIFGYKNFLDQAAFEKSSVEELARLYRLVSQLSGYHAERAELPKLRDRLAETQSQLSTAESELDPKDKKSKKALDKQRSAVAELQKSIEAAESIITKLDSDTTLKPLADAHPDIAEDARAETARLHAGDAENRQLWETFLPQCLEALSAMYERLGIEFDLALGESYYQPMLADVVADLTEKGLATESEGAQCVFLEGNDAPFIVQKRDGAFTYATTDLATIKYRVEQLQADHVLYVVDARQSEHFQLLFATARKWGFDQVDCRHISFGTILGDDKKPFKTRSGDTVGLESLLDEAVSRAAEIVAQNDDGKPDGPELGEHERSQVAETVGIGGIKYADLHHNRESDYVFSWDKMLATTGDTATYMQYAHARVGGIFRRGEIDRESVRNGGGQILLTHPQERALALQLVRFPDAVEDASVDCRPNLITQYLFETANAFSAFHRDCHVIKAESEELKASRLLLCDVTARVLEKGLSLLGIQVCERM